MLSGMLTSLTCHVSNHAPNVIAMSWLTRLSSLFLHCEEEPWIQHNLSLLQLLSSLHHLQLTSITDSCTDLVALSALQELVLVCHGPICDLASCTQLTKLMFDESTVQKICLPKSDTVQLQSLHLENDSGAWQFTLENLGNATQLTCLSFEDCYPGQLHCHIFRSLSCSICIILFPHYC